MIISEKIMVHLKDISLDSTEEICVSCDKCLKLENIQYNLFNEITKNNTEEYFCSECKFKK